MPRTAVRTFFVTSLLLSVVLSAAAQDFKKQVIYQIVTDRFVNGDTSNDNPSQSPGLFDATKTNWHLYWGGDLAGINSEVSYLKNMGITAIWMLPVVPTQTRPAIQARNATMTYSRTMSGRRPIPVRRAVSGLSPWQ